MKIDSNYINQLKAKIEDTKFKLNVHRKATLQEEITLKALSRELEEVTTLPQPKDFGMEEV
tara:strand:+ start:1933 stop:2115 length:183 start_codon:yes stop_codon:yes gene_type:complete